jgi:hypothetical protein
VLDINSIMRSELCPANICCAMLIARTGLHLSESSKLCE